MPPTKDEIRLIAQEVGERYFGLMKEYVEKEVQLHAARCTAGKFSKIISIISAVIGGILVAMFNWFLQKEE